MLSGVGVVKISKGQKGYVYDGELATLKVWV